MTMKIPDRVIRKEIEKQFRFRGVDCICLTKAQFQQKWDMILFRISRYRYTNELLESYRSRIESKVAWIPEEYVPPKKVEVLPIIVKHPTQIVVIPKRLKYNDGYDILRDTKPKLLKWKVRN